MLAKWILLGSAVGILAGTASAIFLTLLNAATDFRIAHPELLFFLPLVGLGIGWIYQRFAGSAARGNNLVIEEVNLEVAQAADHEIPLRMTPLVLFGTILTHLFGGSAGREGTAIQMGSSLADHLRQFLGLNDTDRRLMIMAGISGGFGSVFGTPIAGFVFGLEVQSVGRIRYEGVIPCLVAAVVGDLVTRAWGVTHSHYPALANVEIEPVLLIKIVIAGILFGLTSLLFIELTHLIKRACKRFLWYPPLYPFVGGLVIIGLTLLLNTQDYLGLSLPLIRSSMDGTGVVTFAFLLKVIFTAVTLGTGFLGGEVTPLFVMGSTLGYTLGIALGVDPVFMAALGFVAVFAGASNTPLACAMMGVELFGGGSVLYLAIACFVAYLASGHRGIYVTQRIDTAKTQGVDIIADESLEQHSARRHTGKTPDKQAGTGKI
jgi:H+/Cl- antiporter ClcA